MSLSDGSPSSVSSRFGELLLTVRSHLTRYALPEGVFLGATVLVVAAYSVPFLDRGWIPHDEGTIAQSAERALGGELPHRDYDEGYTGLLTWAHAFAFQLFGVRLLSLRYLLFVCFLVFTAAMYRLSRRFMSPPGAALLALLGAVWSVPNYFASLPSWYNLFLAALSALAIFRHLESGRRRWLFLAGVLAGVSVLVKIVGLYALAALLLFLAYREQRLAATRVENLPRRDRAFRLAQAVLVIAGIAILVVVFARPPFALRRFFQFVLPASVPALLLLIGERRTGGRSRERFVRLAGLAGPLLGGFLLPIALFLVPFIAGGAIPALARGLFVLPARQIGTAAAPPDPLEGEWLALLMLVALLLPRELPPVARRLMTAALALFALVLLLMSRDPIGYHLVWSAARSLGVLAPVVIAGYLETRYANNVSEAVRLRLFLFASLTSFLALVQFPFARPVYFCYVAPLAALAAAALATAREGTPRAPAMIVLLLFLGFGLVRMNPGYVFRLGRHPGRYEVGDRLSLARGGLRIPPEEALEYENLVSAIQRHAPRGEIYAGPDCPEVYFLAARRNLTRHFFDFLSDTDANGGHVLRLIAQKNIRVVVLNDRPPFSRPPSPTFRHEIALRYPCSERIGKFTVLWKDRGGCGGPYDPAP